MLERIAYGGGSTNWYYCRGPADLDAVAWRLAPGSIVVVFFDDRIRQGPRSAAVVAELERIVAGGHEAIVGALADDRVTIEIQLAHIDRHACLADVGSDDPDSPLFYGPYPDWPRDDPAVVTFTVPDLDGIVGSHPH